MTPIPDLLWSCCSDHLFPKIILNRGSNEAVRQKIQFNGERLHRYGHIKRFALIRLLFLTHGRSFFLLSASFRRRPTGFYSPLRSRWLLCSPRRSTRDFSENTPPNIIEECFYAFLSRIFGNKIYKMFKLFGELSRKIPKFRNSLFALFFN
jgi:hypothetical protein